MVLTLAMSPACVISDNLAGQTVDWGPIDQALGRTGSAQPGGVQRYGFPRSDLQVTVVGVRIRPSFALGSWAAFLPAGNGVMVMGDLVLAEPELPAVTSILQQHGIEQTAIHHHILRESPRVLYMHIHARGNALQIARGLRAALDQTGTPPASDAPAPPLELDSAGIRDALGYGGRANGGVYQVNVARAETIRSGTNTIPASMGLGTVINFQSTGNGRAAITGDFVLIGSEVNPVIRTLREGGIVVTALHNHLLDEQPRLFFMHFWANADALQLARTLRAALDKTNSVRS
jgi:hypothetical protein